MEQVGFFPYFLCACKCTCIWMNWARNKKKKNKQRKCCSRFHMIAVEILLPNGCNKKKMELIFFPSEMIHNNGSGEWINKKNVKWKNEWRNITTSGNKNATRANASKKKKWKNWTRKNVEKKKIEANQSFILYAWNLYESRYNASWNEASTQQGEKGWENGAMQWYTTKHQYNWKIPNFESHFDYQPYNRTEQNRTKCITVCGWLRILKPDALYNFGCCSHTYTKTNFISGPFQWPGISRDQPLHMPKVLNDFPKMTTRKQKKKLKSENLRNKTNRICNGMAWHGMGKNEIKFKRKQQWWLLLPLLLPEIQWYILYSHFTHKIHFKPSWNNLTMQNNNNRQTRWPTSPSLQTETKRKEKNPEIHDKLWSFAKRNCHNNAWATEYYWFLFLNLLLHSIELCFLSFSPLSLYISQNKMK